MLPPGANGKVDEVRSAYGLLQLKYVDREIAKRQKAAAYYREHLKNRPGIHILQDIPGVRHNYGYFPILVDAEKYGMTRDALYDKLKVSGIYARRYFYPLCSQFPTYCTLPSALPRKLLVAEKFAQEVLCLPIFSDLSESNLQKVADVVLNPAERI